MSTIKDNVDHLLSLKVMRLIRPTLGTPIVVATDPLDLPGDLNQELKLDPTSDTDLETLTSGQMMLIPQSFGNIFLGEMFSSYVFTHNDKTKTAKNVTVKSELQTLSQRIILAQTDPEKNKELPPGSTIDLVIKHEVMEVGTHILICEVNYCNPLEENKRVFFRKLYKFQVLKPLDIKTKIYNAESDEVFVEAQVQNLTSGPINLEKVSLEATPHYTVTCISNEEKKEPGAGILQPEASCQFLYCLSPSNSGSGEAQTRIGNLDIVWRTNLGERGRLRTSHLQSTPTVYPDIRLSVTQLPNVVKLEEAFSFSCKVSNLSERTIDLSVVLERLQSDMAWIGTSGKPLGPLESGLSVPFNLTIIPLAKGLRRISGLKLIDTTLKRTYDYDDLAQVFVL